MGFREGNQLQKQGEGEEGQEIQGHTGWKEKAQKTSVEAALVKRLLHTCGSGRVFAQAHFIASKAQAMYALPYKPQFLPNPVDIPLEKYTKSSNPSIVWIGRWDPVKQIHKALDVARSLPDFDFHFIGAPSGKSELFRISQFLVEKYSSFRNIHILSFVSEEEKRNVLARSWILLNTSAREGLPVTFLEAAAYGASIVSSVDPDGFASRFGIYVKDANFKAALKEAVDNEYFKSRGAEAFAHVSKIHKTEIVIRKHLEIYEKVLNHG